jgi:hypothetical protein
VNGTVTGGVSYRDHLFRNTGSGFDDVTPNGIVALHADHGVQWADFDLDGDADLALTGSRVDGMHLLLRNLLPSPDRERSISVRVVDGAGRSTRAGAEVRVYSAGPRRLIASRLVDSGSGYDSQNDIPVHIGLPAGVDSVYVEAIFPRQGRRAVIRSPVMAPAEWRGKTISVRVP